MFQAVDRSRTFNGLYPLTSVPPLAPFLVSPLPAGVIGGGGGGVEVLSWSVRFPGTKGTYVSVGWSGCKHIAAQVRNIAASW